MDINDDQSIIWLDQQSEQEIITITDDSEMIEVDVGGSAATPIEID